MKRNYLFLSLLLFFFAQSNFAQVRNIEIKGIVTSDQGEILIGVTVAVVNTAFGTITDPGGEYSILVSRGDKLLFSYVGYETQTITISDQTTLDVKLKSANLSLDDVIVVGYATQKKESVVGSIVQATGEDIKRSSSGGANLVNSLSGLLPGVITQQRSGKPGDNDTDILIRAQNTWNNSAPLVLVDGVERALNEVNPNEIDKISVLKDASATAVFGVKGGNGVILVTTKRGKKGKPQLSFDTESTYGYLSRLPDMANTYEGIKHRNYAILNEFPINNQWGRYVPNEILEHYRTQEYPEFYQDFNWKEKMLKDFSSSYKVNMDASGGTDFVRYFTSFGYQHQGSLANTENVGQGYNPEFSYKRFNFRSNLDFNLSRTTVFSVHLGGYLGIQKEPPSTQDFYVGFFEKPGDDPIFQYSDGIYGGSINPYSTYMGSNPFVEMNLNGQNTRKRSQVNNDFILKQDLGRLTEGLSAQAKLSYDNSFYTNGPNINADRVLKKYIDPAYLDAGPDADIEDYTTYIFPRDYDAETNFDYFGRATTHSTERPSTGNIRRQLYYQFSLNYDRSFGDHNVGALGLMSRQETTLGSNFTRYREDWVGRITYDYQKIYLFEANGAYNGSEKFAGKKQVKANLADKSYRFGFFPSMATGIMISNMDFFKENVSFMNTLKLRYSMGIVGVDEAPPPWQYLSDWEILNWTHSFGSPGGEIHSIYPWRKEGAIANPDLHWEEVRKQNIALEMGVFNNMLSLSADYFWDHRYDIFIEADDRVVPFYYGAKEPPAGNLGETKSSGYEFELKMSKKFLNGLHLFGGLAYTHIQDEVLKREEPDLYEGYQSAVGFPIGQPRRINNVGVISSWDEIYTGVLNSDNSFLRRTLPGDYRHLDFNADGVIDTYDSAPFGYPHRPHNTYSFRLGARYKGFEAFVFIYGVFNVTRNENLRDLINSAPLIYNDRLDQAYSPELGVIDNATFHQLRWDWQLNNSNEYIGNGFYKDGAYTRLKNAEIAYTLNPKFTKRLQVSSWRFYINGTNLLFWSKQWQDQERGGFSRSTFPMGGSFQIGSRITF